MTTAHAASTPPEEATMHGYTTGESADGIWYLNHTTASGEWVTLSTHPTEIDATQEMITLIAEDARRLRVSLDISKTRHDSTTLQLDRLRDLIEALPWDEINSGNFSPQQGCGDVAMFREAAIDLGCSERINIGAEQSYEVMCEAVISITITVSAISEDMADEAAQTRLDDLDFTPDDGTSDYTIDDTETKVLEVQSPC